jgi:adenylosuccinate lyase
MADLDLVSKLESEERAILEFSMKCVSPNDAKYAKASKKLAPYLSPDAELRGCVILQYLILKTRMEFGQAEQKHVDEVNDALTKVSPLNILLLEEKVTKHDQLAVIEEIGRYTSLETKALLHPGTTSYDILDTTRAHLFKKAWFDVIRPQICEDIEQFCKLSEKSDKEKIIQVGRTHLQNTSPVPFGLSLSIYAARLAERLEKCDQYFQALKGKISGIVGTGAGIDIVIGKDKSIEFEKKVLEKLNLEPDYTSTQITSKERLADIGHGLTSLMHVLANFANDMRILYSSAIGEVTSRENADRLGGSSTDATKNNPIDYENMAGKAAVVEGGMRPLYAMTDSNLGRDLRNSVQGRYQPQEMMVETSESFSRLNKSLKQLSINKDRIQENLIPLRRNPGEAMGNILKHYGFVHPEYGDPHNFVKEIGKIAIKNKRPLINVAKEDPHFEKLYDEKFSLDEIDILNGMIEKYTGSSYERAKINRDNARKIITKKN